MSEHVIQAGDLRVHYHEWGQGEPVVLLHGWPETSHEWRVAGPAIADAGFRVLAPDTRGHGRTDKPASGYTRAELARDVVTFLDALELPSAALVGHDWGGIIAAKAAFEHGERFSRLALLDTITTGWPLFVDYYYWFMDPELPEAFFESHARSFITSILGLPADPPVPGPPESPFQMPPELLAVEPWATPADIDAYVAPYLVPGEIEATCKYYRSLRFHRVVPDPSAANGERYEPVSHGDMATAWREGRAGGEHLDFGVEDRHRSYGGPMLWMRSAMTMGAAGEDDPAFANFPRQFPDLERVDVDGGHFFVEERPDETASRLAAFLDATRHEFASTTTEP